MKHYTNMTMAIVVICRVIMPNFAMADKLDETMGVMSMIGQECSKLDSTNPDLVSIINDVLSGIENYKANKSADQLADFQVGVESETSKIEGKPIGEMDCAMTGLYFIGFASGARAPK